MKILVRNDDATVIYARSDLVLSSEGVSGDGWRDAGYTTATATLLDVADDAVPAGWFGGGWTYADGMWTQQAEPPAESVPTQFERDQARYTKRAAVKDQLLAYMAADNMSRVRAQDWTVADLTGLVADPSVKAALDFMGTLSFELAAQAIASAATPLLTPEIRADWAARLQAHFYLEG